MPDFHHALMLSRGHLKAADLAECHGVLCGLICRDGSITHENYLARLADLQLVVEPPKALSELFVDAHISTLQQLADMDLGFNLWLPDDDQPLFERTDALAQWCTGFLAGLGLGGALPALSEEANEALEDIRQIARASYPQVGMTDAERDAALAMEADTIAEADDEPDEGEQNDESAFMEIVEYVRVVTLMLCEEMRGPGVEDRIH
jgi:uncharacterized protein YgfB (UPF0149 family)